MPGDTKEQDRHEASPNETEDHVLNRRNILLGSSALVAAATLTSGALAQAQKAAPAQPRQPLRQAANQISSSSGATISASPISAPIRTA